jgi:Xaa-Pro aminopeptidase
MAAGGLIVLDFGGVCDGYCADLTRTISIGPAAPGVRRVRMRW